MTFAEALLNLRQFIEEAGSSIKCGDLLDAVEAAHAADIPPPTKSVKDLATCYRERHAALALHYGAESNYAISVLSEQFNDDILQLAARDRTVAAKNEQIEHMDAWVRAARADTEHAAALVDGLEADANRQREVIDLLLFLYTDAGLPAFPDKPASAMRAQRDLLAKSAYDVRVRLDAIRSKLAETEAVPGAIASGLLLKLHTILDGVRS